VVGAQPKVNATVARRYSLTLVCGALNILNIVNQGTPNGTFSSPLFGRTQSLADGPSDHRLLATWPSFSRPSLPFRQGKMLFRFYRMAWLFDRGALAGRVIDPDADRSHKRHHNDYAEQQSGDI
jgi:hypothetical protein